MRAVINAVMAVATGLARHVLVYRTVTESTAQGTGRPPGHRGRRRRGIGGGRMQWTHPVPGVLGGELAGHVRAAPHPRVRHHPRAAGQIAMNARAQRRPEPQGHLPRPDDDGGLPRGPDDLHAVLPVRLRRPGRRLDRGDRVARPSTPPDVRPPGRSRRGGRHRACGAGRRGTSSTT